jgi:hypothetical protein
METETLFPNKFGLEQKIAHEATIVNVVDCKCMESYSNLKIKRPSKAERDGWTNVSEFD